MKGKERVTWSRIHKLTKELAKEVRYHCCIDKIVAIARGGMVPARYLAKHLNVKNIQTLGIEFYDDTKKKFRVPHVYQTITEDFKKYDIILLVDDVVDSGESMGTAIKELKAKGGHDIVTCSLHYKPKSTYEPDFYGEKVSNSVWLEYDWE